MKRSVSLVLLLFFCLASPVQAAEKNGGALLSVFSLLLAKPSVTVSEEATYQLTTRVIGNGSGTITPGSGLYPEGTTLNLVATPATGSVFSGWGGACSGTAPCTVVMNTDITVTATFTAVSQGASYPLTTIINGAGTVTKNPDLPLYPDGSRVTLSAMPADGYAFSGWSGPGINCPGTGPCTVVMDNAKTVTATFDALPADSYTLNISVEGSGSGRVDKNPDQNSYISGSTVVLNAQPDPGSVFSYWSGDCSGSSPSCTVIMDQTKNVTAIFNTAAVSDTAYLYVVTEGTGRILGNDGKINCGYDCSESYPLDSAVQLEAVDGDFLEWQIDTGGGNYVTLSGANPLSLTIDKEQRIKAVFTQLNTTVESETNNTFRTADSTSVNTVILGELSTLGDEDWFLLGNNGKTLSSQTVEVSFRQTQPSTISQHWVIRVLRYRGPAITPDLLTEVTVDGDDGFNVTLPLDNSFYFFAVTSDGDEDNFEDRMPYELIVRTGSNLDPAETEYDGSTHNNSAATADVLAFDTTMHGSIMAVDDQDWYRMETGLDRTATVAFTGASRFDEDGRDWVVSVYRADGTTMISRIEVTGGDDFNIALPVTGSSAEVYYLAVAAAAEVTSDTGPVLISNGAPYTLTVRSNDGVLTPVAEVESNGDAASATAADFSSGLAEMTGQLMSESDQDWFVFETSGSASVNVTVVFTPDVEGTHWRIFLYKEGDYSNNLNTQNTGWYPTYGTSGAYPFTVTLPEAGRYYFKVLFAMDQYITEFSSAQYTIQVD